MKKILFLIVFTLIFLPETAFAHLAGQAPYFKINDKFVLLYPVPLTSLNNFNLPQDLAPENYLINQPIHFEFDINQLPVPPEVVQKTLFSWEFGDGNKGEGLKQDHTYSKIGSYIIDIYAADGTTPTPQIIEKTLVNILPSLDYKLPQAVIKVNGQASKDPLTDILQFKFGENLQFDATASKSTNKITSYFWDFGDQKSDDNPATSHTYAKDLTQVFVVLRVKDQNNFIGDNFLEIQNQLTSNQKLFPNTSSKPATPANSSPSQLKYTLIALGILIVLFIIYWKFKKK